MGIPRYVDVNVFVYWLGGHPLFGSRAYEWIRKVEKAKRGEYVTSTLTVYEVLVIIAGLTGRSLGDRGFVERVVEAIISLKGLMLTSLGEETLTEASIIMDRYGIDYEDALHLAVALKAGAKEIISDDEDFDRTPLKRLF